MGGVVQVQLLSALLALHYHAQRVSVAPPLQAPLQRHDALEGSQDLAEDGGCRLRPLGHVG